MNSFGPMEIGLIVAIVVAVICLILFLVALKSKKKHSRPLRSNTKQENKNLAMNMMKS